MQAGTFTPSQVLQIMGPSGSISGPQTFTNNTVDQVIPEAKPGVQGSLSGSVTVPNYDGTFTVADVTVSLNITDVNDSNLTAELIAPNGTSVALFTNVGPNGQNFTSTVLDQCGTHGDCQWNGAVYGVISADGQFVDAGRLECERHLDAEDPQQFPDRAWRFGELVAEHHTADHDHAGEPRQRADEHVCRSVSRCRS